MKLALKTSLWWPSVLIKKHPASSECRQLYTHPYCLNFAGRTTFGKTNSSPSMPTSAAQEQLVTPRCVSELYNKR